MPDGGRSSTLSWCNAPTPFIARSLIFSLILQVTQRWNWKSRHCFSWFFLEMQEKLEQVYTLLFFFLGGARGQVLISCNLFFCSSLQSRHSPDFSRRFLILFSCWTEIFTHGVEKRVRREVWVTPATCPEHPFTSWSRSDEPHTGFGSLRHHSWRMASSLHLLWPHEYSRHVRAPLSISSLNSSSRSLKYDPSSINKVPFPFNYDYFPPHVVPRQHSFLQQDISDYQCY